MNDEQVYRPEDEAIEEYVIDWVKNNMDLIDESVLYVVKQTTINLNERVQNSAYSLKKIIGIHTTEESAKAMVEEIQTQLQDYEEQYGKLIHIKETISIIEIKSNSFLDL